MKDKAREYVTEPHSRAEDHHPRVDGTEDPLVGAEDHHGESGGARDHHGGSDDHHDGAGGTVIESTERLQKASVANTGQAESS